MNQQLLSLYGLKFNPFCADLPVEALEVTAQVESFAFRAQQSLLREGGFAMVTGDPGTGKSVAMRILSDRFSHIPDVTVGVVSRPQANLADFYREMGEVFGVSLRPNNCWGGTKVLRERWQGHIQTTRVRPVLMIDEAQEMRVGVLSELRLLSSLSFDSRMLLSVVLAGDGRLVQKLKGEELLALASRIRLRLPLEYARVDELAGCLKHLLEQAGNAALMTAGLVATLCDHAVGNYRVLMNMAAELLAAAAQRELAQLDEKLYLDVFATSRKGPVTPMGRRP